MSISFIRKEGKNMSGTDETIKSLDESMAKLDRLATPPGIFETVKEEPGKESLKKSLIEDWKSEQRSRIKLSNLPENLQDEIAQLLEKVSVEQQGNLVYIITTCELNWVKQRDEKVRATLEQIAQSGRELQQKVIRL
jgi:hypothetical protein